MAAEPIDGTLAEGLLAINSNVLYTVPDGMRTRISWISVFNNSGANVVCLLFIRRDGNSRRFARADLAANGGHARLVDRDEDLRLSEGDAIQGSGATGDVIEFTISGAEEKV